MMMPRPAHPTPGSGPPDSTQTIPLNPFLRMSSSSTSSPSERRVSRTVFWDRPPRSRRVESALGSQPTTMTFLPHFGQPGHRVLSGGRLADSSLTVYGDFPHRSLPVTVEWLYTGNEHNSCQSRCMRINILKLLNYSIQMDVRDLWRRIRGRHKKVSEADKKVSLSSKRETSRGRPVSGIVSIPRFSVPARD